MKLFFIFDDKGINSLGCAFCKAKSAAQTVENLLHRHKLQRQHLRCHSIYEFKWRTSDPQVGRFWQIDPFTDKYRYNRAYAFSEDKVIAHRELEGLEAWTVNNPNGTTSSFSGPYANQKAAQAAFDNKRVFGERLNIGSNGMVISSKITQNRALSGQEHGSLTNVIGIVLHRTAGSNVSGAVAAMKSGNLGVHFIIDKDGTITQLASLNAWVSHVGAPKNPDWNFRSTNTIGIEHVGQWDEESQTWEELTEAQIDASAWLVKSLMRNYNIHPYDVRNHEDLRQKQPNEGKLIRDQIERYIYTIDPGQTGDNSSNTSNNSNTNTTKCPLVY